MVYYLLHSNFKENKLLDILFDFRFEIILFRLINFFTQGPLQSMVLRDLLIYFFFFLNNLIIINQ